MNAHRREFLRGLAAAVLVDMALPAPSHAQPDEGTGLSGRIDVHQHFVPERYRRCAEAAGHGKPDGMPALPRWSRQLALDVMDRHEIAAAVLSISSPGVHFADSAAALARAVNEEGAGCVAKHPKRFGLFASLPLPDVEAALREIEFSLDVLKADGIVLLTNYDGIHLGDARFEPLFSELNRRGTLVFIHPTSPYCPACDGASRVAGSSYPAPMLEFMFETTRAVTHLILSGTLNRHRKLRVIVPHAGAALPTLSDRIAGMLPALAQRPGATAMPRGKQVLAALRDLYYDVAGHAVPKMLDALLRTTGIDHLLYGSDWPFTPEPVAEHLAQQLAGVDRFNGSMRAQLARGNALNLLPRLRAALQ